MDVGLLGGSDDKASTYNVGDLDSILGLGRSSGEGEGYPLQYSDLENSMGCIVHGVKKSWIQLSDFHFDFILKTLEILQESQKKKVTLQE